MVGVPLFIGFIPKLQFAQAAFALTWQKWPVLLALALSTLLNVLYFLYTAMVLWLPQRDGAAFRAREQRWRAAVPAAILLALGIVLGVHSAPLTALLQQGFALFCRY